MKYQSNQVTAVFGQSGTGKTTYLFKTMEQSVPFVFIDPLFDPKFQEAKVYHIKTMEEAFHLFREGKPLRIYASPDAYTFDCLVGLCLAHGNITIIVDELDNYSDSHYLTPYFRKAVKYGRHKGVNIIAAVRRPKEMNLMVRSQANKFVIFPLGGEDARDLEPYIGSYWKEIIALNPYNYLEYTFAGKNIVKKELKYSA